MGHVKGQDRYQVQIPMSLDEMIDKNNPVRLLDYLVDSMDLKKLGFHNAMPNELGRPSYSANDMLKLYLYGYEHGIRSTRRLETEAKRNLELIWLLRGLRPDYKTIGEFMRKNPRAFKEAFQELVFLLDQFGLLGKELFAVDGTKIKASNNKKRNFSKAKLTDKIKRINESIAMHMAQIDENDRREESEKKVAVEKAIAELNVRKKTYESYLQTLEASGENEISTVDPDAKLMGNNRGGVDVSYNVQSAVDAKHSLVVEINVTKNPADHGQLSVMGKRIRKRFKLKKRVTFLADKGYYNGEDLRRCQRNKIVAIVAKPKAGREVPNGDYALDKFKYEVHHDSYRCPEGKLLPRTGTKASKLYCNKKACSECSKLKECTTGTYRRITLSNFKAALDANDQRLLQNKELYRKRQMIVEHPLGTIKRSMNGSYFLLRTIKKVRGEVALLFLAYNFKRLKNILGFAELEARLRALLSLFSTRFATLQAILEF